jgi:hypothetical protein
MTAPAADYRFLDVVSEHLWQVGEGGRREEGKREISVRPEDYFSMPLLLKSIHSRDYSFSANCFPSGLP